MLNLYPPSAHDLYKGVALHFSSDIDNAAKEVHKAVEGLGTDEKKLTHVLGPKSPDHRFLIAARYKQLFNESLKDRIKSETSGHYGKLLTQIAVPLPEAEAEILRNATHGLGTKEKLIYPIVVGRTNDELAILKKTYFDLFNEDLASRLDSELSGDLKKVIMASIQGALVPYNSAFHTADKAEKDAEDLYKAGQGKFGTDEEAFIRVLVTSPPEHLRAINAAYTKKHGNGIIKAVEKEFTGDAEKALLFLVRMTLEPLELLAEIFESTMKGFGTDEDALAANLVRYHIVLPQIKETYKKLYKKELRERIQGEVSGDFGTLLLAVFDAHA